MNTNKIKEGFEEGFEIVLNIIILLEILGGMSFVLACGIMALIETYLGYPCNWGFVAILSFTFLALEIKMMISLAECHQDETDNQDETVNETI